MKDDCMGGIALIAGAIGGIVTMALHPTGHHLSAPGELEPMARLSALVHALAIASTPVSFLGALALARRLTSPDRLALAALVVYGYALVAVMTAAVAGGFVAPRLVREILDATPPERDTWHAVLDYNTRINQAFAKVFTVGSSVAIVLWSASIVRSRALAIGVGIYGFVLGPAIMVALLSGHLRLDVHGMGAVILGQAVWFIIVGVLLCRRGEVISASPGSA